MHVVSEVTRRAHYPALLFGEFVDVRWGADGRGGLVKPRQRATYLRIGDDDPSPTLGVATGWCLDCQPEALQYHVGGHGSIEIESLAHRPCGGEQRVDRGQIQPLGSGVLAHDAFLCSWLPAVPTM